MPPGCSFDYFIFAYTLVKWKLPKTSVSFTQPVTKQTEILRYTSKLVLSTTLFGFLRLIPSSKDLSKLNESLH